MRPIGWFTVSLASTFFIPFRKYIEEKFTRYYIRCVVLMYGAPLKVAPPEPSDHERHKLKRCKIKDRALKNNWQD
jgi:hypothetical protein